MGEDTEAGTPLLPPVAALLALARLAHPVHPDLLDNLAVLETMDNPEDLATTAPQLSPNAHKPQFAKPAATQDKLDHLAHPDLLEPLAIPELLAALPTHTLNKDHPARQAPLDLLEIPEIPVNLANLEDLGSSLKFPADKAHPDLPDHPANPVLPVNLVSLLNPNPDHQAQLEIKDLPAPLAAPANLAPQETTGLLAVLVLATTVLLQELPQAIKPRIYNTNRTLLFATTAM